MQKRNKNEEKNFSTPLDRGSKQQPPKTKKEQIQKMTPAAKQRTKETIACLIQIIYEWLACFMAACLLAIFTPWRWKKTI